MVSTGMPVIALTRSGGYSRDARAELVEAERVRGDVVAILEPSLEQHVHHPERERGVGAGANRDPLVALRGGARSNRIDGDDRRALGPCLEHERPQVRIRRQRVRPPEQHEVALGNAFGVGADVRADRHAHADGAGHRADRAVEHRRADEVEESPVHRRALDHPHRAGVRIGQDRLRSVARTRGSRSAASAISSSASSHETRSNLPRALWADAAQRVQEPIAMVGSLDVAIDLGAEKAAGERVIRVAGNAHGAPVFDGHEHGAGVGAVVRAGAANDGASSAPCVDGDCAIGTAHAMQGRSVDGSYERRQSSQWPGRCSGREVSRRAVG